MTTDLTIPRPAATHSAAKRSGGASVIDGYLLSRLTRQSRRNRLVTERLTEPLHLNLASLFVALFGSFRAKVDHDLIVRQQFAFPILHAADKAREQGLKSITIAEFGEGSGTVTSVLALKLRSYLQSLAKNMGQHAPQSFVAIGDKEVIVIMRGKNTESVLFINKPRFNEAVEQWKTSSKALDMA